MATKKPVCIYGGNIREIQPGDKLDSLLTADGVTKLTSSLSPPDNPEGGDLWVDEGTTSATDSVASRVAAGEVTFVLGSGPIGTWDSDTQARIAARLALGWPLTSIFINYQGS